MRRGRRRVGGGGELSQAMKVADLFDKIWWVDDAEDGYRLHIGCFSLAYGCLRLGFGLLTACLWLAYRDYTSVLHITC